MFFRVNNGAGNFYTEYMPKQDLPGVTLCDGNWHKVRATKSKKILTLTVDGFSAPKASSQAQMSADTNDPLYIGGYPGKE